MKQIIAIALLLMCSSFSYAQRNNNNQRKQTTVSKSKQTNSANVARQRQLAEQRRKEAEERKEQERIEFEKKNALRWDDATKSLCYNGQTYPMVYVSGGSFTMGENYNVGQIFPNNPIHHGEKMNPQSQLFHAKLDSYYIGKYEVTQDLWEKVMGRNPSHIKGERKPVTNVSYNDCQDFLSKLNSLTGKLFRIPSEEQWEFAARGGNKSRGYIYSGSNSLNAVGWYYENSGDRNYGIHDVGMKNPNELGIYDMSGNVMEWCAGIYGYQPSAAGINYKNVVRGGYFGGGGNDCTTTKRNAQSRDFSSVAYGLRIVLVEE